MDRSLRGAAGHVSISEKLHLLVNMVVTHRMANSRRIANIILREEGIELLLTELELRYLMVISNAKRWNAGMTDPSWINRQFLKSEISLD